MPKLEFKEAGLRALFRSADRFPEGTVWLSEPGIGGDLGLPDVWIQLDTRRSRFYAPLELKRGETPLKEFRPHPQIQVLCSSGIEAWRDPSQGVQA